MDKATAVDAINLLCGEQIGEGCSRTVFACRIRDDLVVKVEKPDAMRTSHNVHEQLFWDIHQYHSAIADWLAPCEYLSPDGRVLLQKRCEPLRKAELPQKLPAFITDRHPGNFGRLDGRIVCLDYASTVTRPSTKLIQVEWD